MTGPAVLAIEAFLMLATVLMVLSCLTYMFFWYETAGSSHEFELRKLSGGRVMRLVLRGILSSIWSMGLTVFLYPVGYRRTLWQPEPDPSCTLPAVILIHGLYHNPSAWVLFRRSLRAAGFRNVYALGYNSWTCSFEDLVAQLGVLCNRVGERLPHTPVVLLGHSLGGLIGRAYLSRIQDVEKFGGLVTLGTPHHGSRLAALGMGRLAQSLLFRGPLIEAIEKSEHSSGPIDVPRLAFYSPLDNMVLPNGASIPPGNAWKVEVTAPVSHVSLLYHGPTIARVIKALREMCL